MGSINRSRITSVLLAASAGMIVGMQKSLASIGLADKAANLRPLTAGGTVSASANGGRRAGHSNRAHKRIAAKRRNVTRNRKAHK